MENGNFSFGGHAKNGALLLFAARVADAVEVAVFSAKEFGWSTDAGSVEKGKITLGRNSKNTMEGGAVEGFIRGLDERSSRVTAVGRIEGKDGAEFSGGIYLENGSPIVRATLSGSAVKTAVACLH